MSEIVSLFGVTKIFKDFWGKPKVKAVDKDGFCYAEPSKYTTPVFIGALLADGILTYFSAGTLTQVGVGLTGGVVYLIAQQYENWP